MQKKAPLLTALFVLLSYFSFSQGCPPNIDFEFGNFNNWECSIGSVDAIGNQNVITLTPSPPTANRHEIVNAASGNDYYGGFPQLCPYGSTSSVKLGNTDTHSEAEGLSYTFTIPVGVDTFTFTYFYAVVFENPGHSIYEQPRFFVTAYDVATGVVVNCASYDYVSTGSLPGFMKSPQDTGVLYRNWTPASLQFAGMSGKTVKLEFKTADCTLGGHFGYAYLDVASGCTNILATAPYCIETNSLILNAPYGFQSYTWYNSTYTAVIGTQQSITLSPPPSTSGVFYVDAVPYPGYGCRDTFQAIIKALPVPDTPAATATYKYCQFDFTTQLDATASPGCDLLWYTSATGGTATNTPIKPSALLPGVFKYYVSQKVLFGCESFRREITVTITPSPITSFTANSLRQCQSGNQFIFTSTSTNTLNSTYYWDFGDGNTLTSKTDSVVTHHYNSQGIFYVQLKVVNDSTCFTQSSKSVTIVPKPDAKFNYPPVICQNQTQVNLIDNSSVPNGLGTINSWWWDVNGVVSQTQSVPAFTPTTAGVFPIKLLVISLDGCPSDTNYTNLNIHTQPIATFNCSKPLCDNEVVYFTDASTLPQTSSSENVVKWYWLFNGTATSSQSNPSLHLAAGNNQIKLIAESNFGCQSIEIDSILLVHEKPHISLQINDSCVNRSIIYTATDILGTVSKWSWNFGNGFYTGAASVTKIYYQEGYNPLTIIGNSIYSCKDTVVRPFTIFENKAYAGNDTIAAMGEPIQLNANGDPGETYVWTPDNRGLDSTNIATPIATFNHNQLYRLHSVTKEGCDKDSKILIRRYKGPELYIPTGFTPNNDKLNDVLKVFPVGIKAFHFFRVYNRYGEMIFNTNDYTQGWDGSFNGKPCDDGTYVVVAEAIDYKGNLMINKETVTLIR